jgi:hypothetical protein
MKKSILLLILLAFCVGSSLHAGGPWTQKKGKGYLKISEWWVVFDQHFTDAGQTDPNITTGIFTTAVYAEYGFTDRFTTSIYAPVFVRNTMNNLVSATTGEVIIPGEAYMGPGDLDVGFKYSLTKPGAKFPVAASITLGLPTGTPVAGALDNLQTGDGEFNQMIQIDAGHGFRISNKTNGYASTYVGFNRRSNGFSEEFRFGLEAGLGMFNQKWWITGRMLGVESFKNGGTAETITSTSIFANNSEYLSVSLESSVYLGPKLGVSASVAGALRGEIIAAAPTYSVGVFLDLSK